MNKVNQLQYYQSVLAYGSEAWAKKDLSRVQVTKIRLFRGIENVTRKV